MEREKTVKSKLWQRGSSSPSLRMARYLQMRATATTPEVYGGPRRETSTRKSEGKIGSERRTGGIEHLLSYI